MSLRTELQILPARRLLAGTLWRIFVPLSVVWAAQLIFWKTDHDVGPLGTFFDRSAFLSIPFLLVTSAKLYLFERYSRDHRYWRRLLEDHKITSLPSINKCVHEIIGRIESRSLTDEPQVISIEADWGNGKSRVVKELQSHFVRKAERKRDPTDKKDLLTVLITADIWSYTNHLDLQFALIEELLSHPLAPAGVFSFYRGTSFLRFWNHHTVLVALLFYRFLLSSGRFTYKSGSVEFLAQQTEGLWYFIIRDIIQKLSGNKVRVVWCLDEIDRSTPEIAQQTILLTKRFLNFPGTTIILPYVKGMLYWKVFNPVYCTQPDLRSTMQGIPLLENTTHSALHFQFGDKRALDYFLIDPNFDPEHNHDSPKKHTEAENPTPYNKQNEKNKDVAKMQTRRAYAAVRQAFEMHVLSMTNWDYNSFARIASEKFIQHSRMTLPYPTPEDIAVLLIDTERIIKRQLLATINDHMRVKHKSWTGFANDSRDFVESTIALGHTFALLNLQTSQTPSLRQFISRCEYALYRIATDKTFCEALALIPDSGPRDIEAVILSICILSNLYASSKNDEST